MSASDNLVDALVSTRSGGALIGDPPKPPAGLAEAYRVAEQVMAEVSRSDPAGWKIGATSAGAQEFLGVDEPIRGRIFLEGVLSHPAELPWRSGLEAEPEILLRLRENLTAGDCRGEERARRAIAAAHVGFEVNRPSYVEPFVAGALRIIADNAAHAGLVIGPRIDPSQLAEVTVVLASNGEKVSDGASEAVLGDPLRSLVWLANDLPDGASLGGAWIATGGMCRGIPVAAGDVLEAEFSPGGAVSLTVRADQPTGGNARARGAAAEANHASGVVEENEG
jgi:2-keto-4-pentenoate hydratase